MGHRFVRSELAIRSGDLGIPWQPHRGIRAGRRATAPSRLHIRARAARVAASAGDHALAARHLDQTLPSVQHRRGDDISTLAGLVFAADAAACLGRTDAAQTLLTALRPYQHLVAGIGATICVGAVAHYVGRLEQTVGDLPAAIDSFERALDRHRAMASPPVHRLERRRLGPSPAPARRSGR